MKYNILNFLFLIFICTFSPLIIHGESINSLKEELKSATGIKKTEILVKLAYKYVNIDAGKSLEYGKMALKEAKNKKNNRWIRITYGLIGQSYYKLGNYKNAVDYFKKESQLLKNKGKPWIINQFNLGLSYMYDGKENQAVKYFEESLFKAQSSKYKTYILKNYEALFNAYSNKKRFKTALKYFKLYIAERDEKFIDDAQKEINQMHNAYEEEISKKEETIEYLEDEKDAIKDTLTMTEQELQVLKMQQKIIDLQLEKEQLRFTRIIYILILVAILSIVIVISYLQMRKAKHLISIEKAKSEKLLLNILPSKVVNELKEKGDSIPEKFKEVTVFFSDFAGFTELATLISPEKLINELNLIFTAFDEIMEKHYCERIKTVGDAYLAVCGMPEENPDHVINMLSAALAIKKWLNNYNRSSEIKWQIRIGIHSGNLIGGIVGTKKYIYDIFGDTINTASRMENHSDIGRINVSHITYGLSQEKFKFTERPLIEVKGKGKMKMYFLERKI
ncbi:adenylate/guanylate cyclase domain-containing protein [candidate division KSB1 bacterium]